MLGVQLADVSTRASRTLPFQLEHLVEMSASCTPSIKLSTKNLRCFYIYVRGMVVIPCVCP